MKHFPALDIRFTPEAESAFPLHDRLMAGLDDFRPTAIEESSALWRVFFDSPGSRDGALAWLRTLGDTRLALEPLDLDDEDWARRSQADLQPIRAGRIVVSPPWCADAARESAGPRDVLIVVIPSTGFGTGHHASTRMCLELLQDIPVHGRSVLDIGTGSGVLAIAAARLGARVVIAIDNDADAIAAARENVALNGVAVELACREFPADGVAESDIIVANLTGQLLLRIAADVVSHLTADGDIVVSGVLAEEQEAVERAFQAAGATLRGRKSEDEWVALHLRVTGDR